MTARQKQIPPRTKYKWWKGRERWDLILFGEPDCFAYMMRYVTPAYPESPAWCWTLTMPRGGHEVARGWASAAHTAKGQVEAAIEEHWQ